MKINIKTNILINLGSMLLQFTDFKGLVIFLLSMNVKI